jgi:hypothetical protein
MNQEKLDEIPQDLIDALNDFNQQRFVSMEIALNENSAEQVSRCIFAYKLKRFRF